MHPAHEPLTVICDIAEGDDSLPVLAQIDGLDTRIQRLRTPVPQNGHLVATFTDLPPGDYAVTLRSALDTPDVAPVRDLITIIDPNSEH